MANVQPYGPFGPVCDFAGALTPYAQAVVIQTKVIEDEYEDAPEYGEGTPFPSFLFAPSLLGFQKKGTLIKPVIDYDWENDDDFAEVNQKWAAWKKVTTDEWKQVQVPGVISGDTYCEEPYSTTNLQDEIRGNEKYSFTLRSSPLTYNVNHSTWDDEMNAYAAWTSKGICSFEGKTIAIGNANYFTTELVVPTTTTYTLRYRFSKQGEVWLDKFVKNGTPQQLLNLTETRTSYNDGVFKTKSVTLTAGTYKITIFVENPTVGSFKKDWQDSPAAASLQIWQGSYSVTTVTGIPTVLGMQPQNSSDGITWKDNAWTNAYIAGLQDASGVHTNAESGQTATISLSHAKGLTGTVTIRKNAEPIFNSTTGDFDYYITSSWALTNVTAYGSGYSVDELIPVSYTGTVGGTAYADVKVYEVRSTVTTTGNLIWSTKDNCIGYDTIITSVD